MTGLHSQRSRAGLLSDAPAGLTARLVWMGALAAPLPAWTYVRTWMVSFENGAITPFVSRTPYILPAFCFISIRCILKGLGEAGIVKFCVLASGSSGNAALLAENTRILEIGRAHV